MLSASHGSSTGCPMRLASTTRTSSSPATRACSAALACQEAMGRLNHSEAFAGLPAFTVVGLPDKAVAESRERVRSALSAIGLALPPKRITVNLPPADLLKEGAASFHRQLIKGNLASEYDNEIRLWLEELEDPEG